MSRQHKHFDPASLSQSLFEAHQLPIRSLREYEQEPRSEFPHVSCDLSKNNTKLSNNSVCRMSAHPVEAVHERVR